MNAANPERLRQHVRKFVAEQEAVVPDAELLRRFLTAEDQAAFAALVRRHGTMVFTVCQSVLRQPQDAEDAFQAAFLILANKAHSVRESDSLGGWLQRVAYRVALRARAANARRQSCEANATRPAAVACDDLSWGELRAILHEELAELPERFRAPVVLCVLEGLTREEAARQLGWTETTVKGRLQRGREWLRQRLERRGIGLTAALAATLTGQALAETAVRATGPFTVGTATTAATMLARGFLRPLLSAKMAALSLLMLSAGLLVGSMALFSPKPDSGSALAVQPAVDAHGDALPEGAVARLGTMRFNHGEGLSHLFFAPDGKTMVSEGGGSLRLWDAVTGAELGRLPTVPYRLENLVLTADGKTVVSLNQEPGVQDVVRVWDLIRMKAIRELPLAVKRGQWSVYRRNALSPDGALAAVNLPEEMLVFDLATGRQLYKLAKGGKDVRDVVFAGCDRIVTADTKQVIDVWDARTGRLIRQFAHGSAVEVLTASNDGRWLATLEHQVDSGSRWLDKDVVHVWELDTGTKKQMLTPRQKRWFRRVYFSPDGKRLLTSSYGMDQSDLSVWDVANGERIREINQGYGSVMAVSADGTRLTSGGGSKFEVWDLKTGRQLSGDEKNDGWGRALVFSAAGDRVVLVGLTSLSTWEVVTGRRRDSFEVESVRFMPPTPELSPDGRFALTFIGDREKKQGIVWDVARRRKLHVLPSSSAASAFSPDSSLLATWEASKEAVVIRLREVGTGREVRSFPGGKLWVPTLSFTADGRTLIAAGEKITGYDVATGKELFSWRMKPIPDLSGTGKAEIGGKPADPNDRLAWRGFTVSPDGTRIAVTLDGGWGRQPLRDRIALFDARTGKLLRRWSDSGQPGSDYEQLRFSADGQLLATSDGEVVHVWETATGKELRAFHGHRGQVNWLAFSRGGRRLGSASRDSTVLIWDVTGQAEALTSDAAIEEAWKALEGEDAWRAQKAVWSLARTSAKTVRLLQGKLRPVKPVSREQLEGLIKDLDSEEFTTREKATVELQQLGDLAEPAVRRALEGKPGLEPHRRLMALLARLEGTAPVAGETLRSVRAVRVLEHADTPDARRLLRELAAGAVGARLTHAAKAAVERLSPK